jgi:hypothetical protein
VFEKEENLVHLKNIFLILCCKCNIAIRNDKRLVETQAIDSTPVKGFSKPWQGARRLRYLGAISNLTGSSVSKGTTNDHELKAINWTKCIPAVSM